MTAYDKQHYAMIFAILMLFFAGWVAYSAFEARAYRRVTGETVSVLDAMFLDLRVMAEPGGE